MGLLKKKKKKKLGGLSRGGGATAREQSPLRPKGVTKPSPCGLEGCPNHNPIRKTMMTISKMEELGRTQDEIFADAFNLFAQKTPLLSVCGRVYPHPCESSCNRKDKAVGINCIERFLGDFALEKGLKPPMLTEDKRSEKVAVVGSGPGGLSCAYQLARRGYNVTIFEAFPKTGGMLRYGIPQYRLPQAILDAEVQRIADMGVEIKVSTKVGKDVSYDDMKKEFSSAFIALGAHTGLKLRVDGEDAPNVMTGIDLLHRVAAGEVVELGDNVVVIGGGDTAIDAARIARRLGAKATILYRRTRTEMPAIDEEIVGAEEEGVRIDLLAAPIEIYSDGNVATGMKCQRMELGEPDDSGRRRPVPIEGDTYDLEFSTLVTAISQAPDFTGFDEFIEGRDWFKVDEKSKTKVENAFAGSDNVNLGLVIDAIYHGRRAAEAIHEQLSGEAMPEEHKGPAIHYDKIVGTFYDEKEKAKVPEMAVDECLKNLTAEIAATLQADIIAAEARRCMSCGISFDFGSCWSLCQQEMR